MIQVPDSDIEKQHSGAAQHETLRVAAVVVLFRPGDDVLTSIDSYRDQVDSVVTVDNTETLDPGLVAEIADRGATYVSLGGNRGVAAALNEGCRRARALGFDWALTLDQDSTATPGMVSRLTGCVGSQASADRIAIVAPVCRQADSPEPAAVAGCVELDAALTSGSLTNLAALEELGGFREDFFIDRVDTEYCLRARRLGWRIVQQRDAVLFHTIGRPRSVYFPCRFWVSEYSPLRRYYQVRNALQVRREYGREFPVQIALERRYWRKELVKMALAETHRLEKARMMIRGWLDYRRGRFGKYEDLHPR